MDIFIPFIPEKITVDGNSSLREKSFQIILDFVSFILVFFQYQLFEAIWESGTLEL